MLTVTGTATLSGQLDIPLANRAPVADGARVTILQAASVFGRFSSTNVTGGGFLTAEAVYGTQSVDVQFSRTPYRAVAATENARAVAIALDTALDGSPPETAFPLFTALDALPLDLAGDTLAALADDSPLTLHAMDRLAVRSLTQTLTDQAFEPGLWGITDRQWSSIRNGAGQQLNRATTTVAAGATMDVTDTYTFGVMVGQSEYRASSRLAANRVDGQATQFGVSGAMRAGAWRAAAGIAIGTLDGASARDAVIAAGGLLATHSDGEFLSGDIQVAHASERANLHITVASGLTWAHVSRDAYDEVGSGLDRLSFTEINASSVRAHVSAKARAGLGRATPEVSARLSRELSGARILGQAALAVLPDTPFTLGLQAEKKTWLDLSGRIPFAVTPDFEIAVTGGGVINDAAGGHRIGLSATWRW